MTPTGPLEIFCTLGLRGAMLALAPKAAAQGCAFDAVYQSSNNLMSRIAAGERADLAIVTRAALDDLIASGKITAASGTDIARSGVGLAVRAGAPRPDIGSVAALRDALLAARSIAYTRTGASGIHFARVVADLGIADAVDAKAEVADGFAAEAAARGEAEIAVQQLSELMQVEGIDIVGPLPEAVQQAVTFSAGVFANTAQPDAAHEFVALLRARETAPVLAKHGLLPI